MIRTFYHTERRGTITAEVIDLGAKEPVEVTGLDLLVASITLPPEPPPQKRLPRSQTAGIIAAAAKEEPGTVYDLAERCGLAVSTVQAIVQRRPFVVVRLVDGPKGPKRRIYGVME